MNIRKHAPFFVIIVIVAVALCLSLACSSKEADDTSTATAIQFPEYLGTIVAEPSVSRNHSREYVDIITRKPSGHLTFESYGAFDGIVYLTPDITMVAGSDLWRAKLHWPSSALEINKSLTIFGNDSDTVKDAINMFSPCTWTEIREMLNDTKAPPE
ncbi:hypothetical protein ACFL1U_01870 [Patescibacteria group bacterium]